MKSLILALFLPYVALANTNIHCVGRERPEIRIETVGAATEENPVVAITLLEPARQAEPVIFTQDGNTSFRQEAGDEFSARDNSRRHSVGVFLDRGKEADGRTISQAYIKVAGHTSIEWMYCEEVSQ